MGDLSSEYRKAKRHEAWLNRQAYRRQFGSKEPVRFFRNWPGNPDPCKCGCGAVEYSRSDPTNWWQNVTPSLLWQTKLLLPVWKALYNVLWHIFLVLRERTLWIPSPRGFRAIVITNPLNHWLGTVMTPVRLITWAVVSFVVLLIWVAALLGGVLLVPLYFLCLALLVLLILLIWLFAAVYIVLHGLVFLVGGVASILYLSNPTIGIILIALGIGIEYESKRRRDKNHREEVGQMLRIIEEAQTSTGLAE